MNHADYLQIPVTKDVCIFCTTRLQFASSRPAPRLQRRLFGSTGAVRRPPAAAAAAAQKEDQDDQGWNTDWKADPTTKQAGGGWASNKAVRDLTPEELALRNALQSQSTPSPPIAKQKAVGERRQTYRTHVRGDEGSQRGQNFGTPRPPRSREGNGLGQTFSANGEYFKKPSARNSTGIFRHTAPEPPEFQNATIQRSRARAANGPGNTNPPSAAPLTRADRDAQLDHHIAQTRVGREGDWDCPSCGFDNVGKNRSCRECNVMRPREETGQERNEGLRTEEWKHLRKRGNASGAQPEQHDQHTNTGTTRNPEADARIQAAKRERMTRLESTRDGRFVGFRSGLNAPRKGFGAEEDNYTNQSVSQATQKTQSQPVKSKSEGGWTTWEPFPTGEPESDHLAGSAYVAPTPRPAAALKGWDYPAEEQALAGSSSQTTDEMRISTAESNPEPQIKIRRHVSYGNELEDGSILHRPERTDRSDTQEPEGRARRSGVEFTATPKSSSRHVERKGKNVVSDIDFDEDDEDIMREERRKMRKKKVERTKAFQKAAASPTPIHLPEFISVSNLAAVLRVRVEDFAYKMKDLGFAETNNDHVIDAETAGLIAAEFNYEPIIESHKDRDLLPLPPTVHKSILPARPPVVTIMGHVDHGKTTLLDYLRKSSVAASEHGGITQHIGAFSVSMPGGRLVTFLDTPGHEAFLSMRQRGANVTDIVILVVAADDSVKPQTIEAIKHAQAAKVPMIVAVNKIDKEDSNVEKVKGDLARYGVEIEDYGGDTQVVCVSGKTGQGMNELEDAAVALADILDMRSEVDGQAEGWVLEATTKKAGRVATVLVRRGTLRPGDVIVAGTSWARVRSLRNEAGAMIPSAGPGTPVEIDGWREQPSAGDEVIQAPDEQKAKSVIEYRLEASERTKMAADVEAVNEARRLEQEKREQLEKAAKLAEANPDAAPSSKPQAQDATTAPAPTSQEVFLIIKADVSGSVEAVTDSISALGNSEVRPHILRSGVGPITEFDIDHAAVAKGHIVNFNTTIEGPIQRMAESKDVQIIDQSIIYRLVDDVRKKLEERLAPLVTQRVLGEAEVAQVFEINTKGREMVPVAGCKVRNGVIQKAGKVRVLRGKEVVFDGMLLLLSLHPYA